MIKTKNVKSKKQNPDICFRTEAGYDVRLRWEGAEYRAQMDKHKGMGFVDMRLGSCNPGPLKKYIMEVRNNG